MWLCTSQEKPGTDAASLLLDLLFASLRAESAGDELLHEASGQLHKLLTAAPAALAPRLRGQLEWLQQLALSHGAANEATQSRICEIMAITCKSLPAPTVEATLRSLLPLIPGVGSACVGIAEQRRAIGAMLAFGLISSFQLQAMSISAGAGGQDMAELLRQGCLSVAALLKHSQPNVAGASAPPDAHLVHARTSSHSDEPTAHTHESTRPLPV